MFLHVHHRDGERFLFDELGDVADGSMVSLITLNSSLPHLDDTHPLWRSADQGVDATLVSRREGHPSGRT